MGLDPVVHQDVIKDPIIVELIGLLVGLSGREAPTEEVGINDVTEIALDVLALADLFPDELMETSDVDAPLMRMDIVVVIADVGVITSVIEYAYLDGFYHGIILMLYVKGGSNVSIWPC
jgi:hypothetical protein